MERHRATEPAKEGKLVRLPFGSAFFKRVSSGEAEIEFVVVEPAISERGSPVETVRRLLERNIHSYRDSLRELAEALSTGLQSDGREATIDLRMKQTEKLTWSAGIDAVSIRPRLTRCKLHVALDPGGSEAANVAACADALGKARVDSLRGVYGGLLAALNTRLRQS